MRRKGQPERLSKLQKAILTEIHSNTEIRARSDHGDMPKHRSLKIEVAKKLKKELNANLDVSFSNSIQNLEKKELIVVYSRAYDSGNRAHWVKLTQKGTDVAQKLLS